MQAINFIDYWHDCLYLNIEHASKSSRMRLKTPHLAKIPKDSGTAGLSLGVLLWLHNRMGVEVGGASRSLMRESGS